MMTFSDEESTDYNLVARLWMEEEERARNRWGSIAIPDTEDEAVALLERIRSETQADLVAVQVCLYYSFGITLPDPEARIPTDLLPRSRQEVIGFANLLHVWAETYLRLLLLDVGPLLLPSTSSIEKGRAIIWTRRDCAAMPLNLVWLNTAALGFEDDFFQNLMRACITFRNHKGGIKPKGNRLREKLESAYPNLKPEDALKAQLPSVAFESFFDRFSRPESETEGEDAEKDMKPLDTRKEIKKWSLRGIRNEITKRIEDQADFDAPKDPNTSWESITESAPVRARFHSVFADDGDDSLAELEARIAAEQSESVIRGALADREYEVLSRFLLGHSDEEFADDLTISESTVRVHRKNIRMKLRPLVGVDL